MEYVKHAPVHLENQAGNKIFCIPANFKKFDFESLEREYSLPESHRSITWQNIASAKLGDIIYFYYVSLPSVHCRTERRILMRGVITETTHLVPKCLVEVTDSKELVKAVSIGDLLPISLTDNQKFSFDQLKQCYHVKQFRKRHFTLEDANLFEALEEEAAKSQYGGQTLMDLTAYFRLL